MENLPTLDQTRKIIVEEPFSIIEVEEALIKCKLNKAPGSDGFINDFFKISEMNSNFGFSESFERSDLPNNFLEETITHIVSPNLANFATT